MVKGNPVTAGVHMTPQCTVACVSAWVPRQASLTSAACTFRGGLDISVFLKMYNIKKYQLYIISWYHVYRRLCLQYEGQSKLYEDNNPI